MEGTTRIALIRDFGARTADQIATWPCNHEKDRVRMERRARPTQQQPGMTADDGNHDSRGGNRHRVCGGGAHVSWRGSRTTEFEFRSADETYGD